MEEGIGIRKEEGKRGKRDGVGGKGEKKEFRREEGKEGEGEKVGKEDNRVDEVLVFLYRFKRGMDGV